MKDIMAGRSLALKWFILISPPADMIVTMGKNIVLYIALMAIALSGCGHLEPPPSAADYDDDPVITGGSSSDLRHNLVHHAHRLIGVPYRYGGSSPRSGLDCSGLIYYLHRQHGVKVPRTTAQQFRRTRPVIKQQLKPGDLVFFRLQRKVSHVGLYVGNNQFIHAPSSGKRVQKTDLNDPYWRRRLIRGGRLL